MEQDLRDPHVAEVDRRLRKIRLEISYQRSNLRLVLPMTSRKWVGGVIDILRDVEQDLVQRRSRLVRLERRPWWEVLGDLV